MRLTRVIEDLVIYECFYKFFYTRLLRGSNTGLGELQSSTWDSMEFKVCRTGGEQRHGVEQMRRVTVERGDSWGGIFPY